MIKGLQYKQNFPKEITENARIAIVRTNYYPDILDSLEKHATETLLTLGVKKKHVDVFVASGSWELPIVTKKVALTKKYDGIIVFGCILKGGTYHFEMIMNECGRALMQISVDEVIPVTMEVLAVEKIEQAIERASDDDNNKGIEGAIAVLKTIATLKAIK